MKVNWDKAEQKSATLPDGKYLCQVKNVVLKTTNTGKEMWVVWLDVQEEGEHFRQRLFHNLVFGDSSMWMVKHFFEAAYGRKLTGEDDVKTTDLIDNYVVVTVKGKTNYGPILTYFEHPGAAGSDGVTDEEIPY